MFYGVVLIFVVAISAAKTLAQETDPPRTTPPPALLGQPAPTTTVPSPGSGATINAATGLPVPADTNAAAVTPQFTNAPEVTGVTNTTRGVLRQPTNAPAAARSNVTPIQLQNINRLVTDMNALGVRNRDSTERQRILIENLKAAPVTPIRPSDESINRLGETLAAVVPTINLTVPQRRQLAIDINLALNSGRLSALEAQRVMADARRILQPSAVRNAAGVDELLTVLEGIVSEVQATVAQAAAEVAQPSLSAASTNRPATLSTTDITTEAGQSGGSQSGTGGDGSHAAPPEE